MATLPLGLGAYRRTFANEPEIRLENRYVEAAPTNLKEHVALISRPGTQGLATFDPDVAGAKLRGYYSKKGLFNNDLFIVSGANFWRYDGTTKIHIVGVVHGTDSPRVTWMKGIGYEYLFIADGTALYYYNGGSHASGVLTSDGTQNHAAVITIGTAHYTWAGSLSDPASDGSVTHPWVVKPGATAAEDVSNLVDTIIFDGTPGTDFSLNLTGPSLVVTANLTSADVMTATYVDNSTAGNSIATTETGSHFSWGAATLAGGGTHALVQVPLPDGQLAESVANLASFVQVSVGNTQKFYWIEPGSTTIDPENFAEKESAPDPIIDMATVGDVLILAGSGSLEFWQATGDTDEPFAPIEGRAMSRGIVPGSLVVVDEGTFIMVGNDWRVYSVGASALPISDHGIEERIRVQLRREAGLT